MIGIPSKTKEAINISIEDLFDKLALDLLGEVPRLRNKKLLIITAKKNFGLPHLFVQAMANKTPNYLEEDVLKGLLDSSHNYIEALKNNTKSHVTERIDGLFRKAKAKRQKIEAEEVQAILDEELAKSKAKLKTIVETESTKFRNLGSAMDISRMASTIGDSDPAVFFVVVRDAATCQDCIRLHIGDNGAPRVWKLSEVKQAYFKRGEDRPSIFGLHPNCRCTLTYLSKGFGFDKSGLLTFKGESHDEHSHQNAKE